MMYAVTKSCGHL